MKAIYLLGLLFLCIACGTEASREQEKSKIKKVSCQHCGMYVSDAPEWNAGLQKGDLKATRFCAPSCMFGYLFEQKPTYDSVWVTEYYNNTREDAKQLFFIGGSDVNGPMGPDLVPIKGEENAKAFMEEHKGKSMYRFAEITPAVMKQASENKY